MTQTKTKTKARASAVGLDIGTRAVKALELRRKNGELSIVNCALAEVSAPERWADAVTEVLHAGEFRTRRVVIGVSGRGTLLHTVAVAADRAEDMDALVRAEAEKLLSYPVDDALLDYHIDVNSHGPTLPVLIAAARKTVVDERLAILKKAGVAPVRVDMELAALPNAFEALNGDGDVAPVGSPACLVDFGASKTLIVVSDGVRHLFREFPFGGDKLTEMLAHRMDCPLAEAEAAKLNPGDDMELVKDAIYPGIEDMTAEIRSCIGRFSTVHKGLAVESVLVSGGLTRFSGVVRLIGRMLKKDTRLLNPFETIAPNHLDFDFLNANAHRFAIAFGLACHVRGGAAKP